MSQLVTNSFILEIIDRSFNAVGDRGKKAVWFYLEQNPKFSREKILENIDQIESDLRALFGLTYEFIDAMLRKELQDAIGQNLDYNKSFSQCVKYLQNKPSDATK